MLLSSSTSTSMKYKTFKWIFLSVIIIHKSHKYYILPWVCRGDLAVTSSFVSSTNSSIFLSDHNVSVLSWAPSLTRTDFRSTTPLPPWFNGLTSTTSLWFEDAAEDCSEVDLGVTIVILLVEEVWGRANRSNNWFTLSVWKL